MILALFFSVTALAAPPGAADSTSSWIASLPTCEVIEDQKKREEHENREADQFNEYRQVHMGLEARPIHDALARQLEAHIKFIELRQQVCRKKRELSVRFSEEAQRVAGQALRDGANNCLLYGTQGRLDSVTRESYEAYKNFLDEKQKTWAKEVQSRYKGNLQDIEHYDKSGDLRPPPGMVLKLRAEALRLWVKDPKRPNEREPTGFFMRISGFLAREQKGTELMLGRVNGRSETMDQYESRCASMGSPAAQGRTHDPNLTPNDRRLGSLAEREAAACRQQANFLGGGYVCPKNPSASIGKCYEAVADAIGKSGHMGRNEFVGQSAINLHDPNMNPRFHSVFENVIGAGYSPYNAPEGSVLVYRSLVGSPHGHVEIHSNGRNCSDYCSAGPPGPPTMYELVGVYVPRTQR